MHDRLGKEGFFLAADPLAEEALLFVRVHESINGGVGDGIGFHGCFDGVLFVIEVGPDDELILQFADEQAFGSHNLTEFLNASAEATTLFGSSVLNADGAVSKHFGLAVLVVAGALVIGHDLVPMDFDGGQNIFGAFAAEVFGLLHEKCPG